MKQLSGPDAMYLYTESDGFPMHIGGVSIYDQSTSPGGNVRFKDILAMFEGRLDRSPIFRRKLAEVPFVLDTPYWIDDDNFDLEFHVRHIALPKPGDWRQLCIQVARLHARPLDRGRPLWEAYIKAQGTQLMLDFMDTVPSGMQALLVQASSLGGMAEKHPMTNTMITNVPGSPHQLYMCGAQIVDSFGIGPLSPGIGLFHTVNSMVMKNKGVITLAFVSCRDAMPDPGFYKDCLNESFRELQAAVGSAQKKGRRKKLGS